MTRLFSEPANLQTPGIKAYCFSSPVLGNIIVTHVYGTHCQYDKQTGFLELQLQQAAERSGSCSNLDALREGANALLHLWPEVPDETLKWQHSAASSVLYSGHISPAALQTTPYQVIHQKGSASS